MYSLIILYCNKLTPTSNTQHKTIIKSVFQKSDPLIMVLQITYIIFEC